MPRTIAENDRNLTPPNFCNANNFKLIKIDDEKLKVWNSNTPFTRYTTNIT